MKTLKLLTLISIVLIGIEATAQVNSKLKTEEFQSIDTDGNGIIEKSEMIAYYRDKTDKNGNPIHGIVLFVELDANNDNIVTLEEFFKDSVSKQEKTRVADNPKKANPNKVKSKTPNDKEKKKEKFRRIDINEDNIITLQEMVYFNKDKKNKKGEPVESELLFYALDKNKNDEVTLREFLKKADWKLGKQRIKLIESKTN